MEPPPDAAVEGSHDGVLVKADQDADYGASSSGSWSAGSSDSDGGEPDDCVQRLHVPAPPDSAGAQTFNDVTIYNEEGGRVQVGNIQNINIHMPAGTGQRQERIVLVLPAADGGGRRVSPVVLPMVELADCHDAHQSVFSVTAVLDADNDDGLDESPPDGPPVVRRHEWRARPPRSTSALTTPVRAVVIEHTATGSCYSKADGAGQVAGMQQFHMDARRWDDIAYNFLVGGDGRVYEGRGWDAVGAFARGWNSTSLGVGVIGTFTLQPPAAAQSLALQRLLQWGVDLGKVHPQYRLYGKCQLADSDSPGSAFMDELRTWGHWHDDPAERPDYT